MAEFPVNGVLDDFNRANAEPPGSGWSTTLINSSGATNLGVNSNVLRASFTPTSGYWATNSFTGGELFVTLAVVGDHSFSLRLCIQSPGTQENAYYVQFNPSPGNGATIYRIDNDISTNLAVSSSGLTYNVGDSYGFEATANGRLTVYYKASGGSWAAVAGASVTDYTYISGGYIGVRIDASTIIRLDDFGGGNARFVSADAVAITYRKFPKTMLRP